MIGFIRYVLLVAFLTATVYYVVLNFQSVWCLCQSAGSTYFSPVCLSIVLSLLFSRRYLSFLENLQHEGTHLLFAMLSFRRSRGIYVSTTGGSVDIRGGQRNGIVALSPYFFPLFAVLLMVISILADLPFGGQIVIASYCWYLVAMTRSLAGQKTEVLSFGTWGVLTLIALNFWMSLFVFNWCLNGSLALPCISNFMR